MPLDTRRIAAIIFDVDGTLSDTDDLWVGRIQKILHPVRFIFHGRHTLAPARRLVMGLETPGNWGYQLLDRLNLDDEAAMLINFFSQTLHDRNRPLPVIPGVEDMLAMLHTRFPLAVVSARGENSTLNFLNQHNLRPYFGAVATAQTCTFTKPYPDPLLWAAAELGVAAEQCLMVGDTTVDIRAGKAAGTQTVGVLCGFGTGSELLRAGADLVLPTTAQLSTVLSISEKPQPIS